MNTSQNDSPTDSFPIAAEEANLAASQSEQLRCLVVDDSSADLAQMTSFLEELGHQVRAVQDPRQVEKELNENSYDFVMLDVVMPERNGYEVLRSIRQTRNNTPTIIVSSKREDSDLNWAFLQGASGYLIKPYSLEELAQCLTHARG